MGLSQSKLFKATTLRDACSQSDKRDPDLLTRNEKSQTGPRGQKMRKEYTFMKSQIAGTSVTVRVPKGKKTRVRTA